MVQSGGNFGFEPRVRGVYIFIAPLFKEFRAVMGQVLASLNV